MSVPSPSLLQPPDPPPSKAPVSACLIVRDDPHLRQTLDCLAPWVAEIIVLFTSKGVGDEPEAMIENACKAVGAKLIPFYGSIGKDGIIKSFAEARNESFYHASQPWIMWADSDDEIVGLENLAQVIEQASLARSMNLQSNGPGSGFIRCGFIRVCAFYETLFDKYGGCIERVVRERIIPNSGTKGKGALYEWQRPIHERLHAKDASSEIDVMIPHIVWKHRPGIRDEKAHSLRNLTILENFAVDQLKKGIEDDRTFYELGIERMSAGLYESAEYAFTKCYIISKTSEDKANAALRLSHLAWRAEHRNLSTQIPRQSIRWADAAIALCGRFDDFFSLAKMYWTHTIGTQETWSLQEAEEWTNRALNAPIRHHSDLDPTDRPLAQGLLFDLDKCRREKKSFFTTRPIPYGGIVMTPSLRETSPASSPASSPPTLPGGEAPPA